MGWLFTQGYTRKDLVEKLTKDWTGEDGKTRHCLEHSSNGTYVLWAVWQVGNDESDRFIACYLTKNDKGFGWGYKGMSESMGPGYYGCPLRFLDMVPVPDSPYASEWREKVKEYHAKRSRKFEVGQVVKLIGSTIPFVVIVSVRPLHGTYQGKRYRLPRRMLGDVMEPAFTVKLGQKTS